MNYLLGLLVKIIWFSRSKATFSDLQIVENAIFYLYCYKSIAKNQISLHLT